MTSGPRIFGRDDKCAPSWWETPRTRWFLRLGFPLLHWRGPISSDAVYLTFDDGPTAEATDLILERLQARDAKATFFCLGQNIDREPERARRIVEQGHSIGNHTYSHLAGWSSSIHQYQADIERCDQSLSRMFGGPLRDFRPPFGRLGLIQGMRLLRQRRIIMWDVNSMDYRPQESPRSIADRVLQNAQAGSIILMHDSPQFGRRTVETLPIILDNLLERKFQFRAL